MLMCVIDYVQVCYYAIICPILGSWVVDPIHQDLLRFHRLYSHLGPID